MMRFEPLFRIATKLFAGITSSTGRIRLTGDNASKVVDGLLTAGIIALVKWVYPRVRNRTILKRLDADPYTSKEIKRRVAGKRPPYVSLDCQDSNPASPGAALVKRDALSEIDQLIGGASYARLVLVMADTGMGKSTLLEKYYAYHWRSSKRSRRFTVSVIQLNELDVPELLRQVTPQLRGETVLLLDGLDEDRSAIQDFDKRIAELFALAGKFRSIVITCRTQFLGDPRVVLEQVRLPKRSGPIPLNHGRFSEVQWFFLSPLSDRQVSIYLRIRFPYWWRPVLRIRAKRAASRFGDLMSRPLLLTFIQDLASSSEAPKYSFQVFRLIVDDWLDKEEEARVQRVERHDLLAFSETFAMSLFHTNRDRMPLAELQVIAASFRVGTILREVRERSLLHNDAEGNWKFAHRSIMEYFLANAVVEAVDLSPWRGRPWSSQMRLFVSEMLVSGQRTNLQEADLRGLDLRAVDLSSRDLTGANLRGANLAEANLQDTALSNGDLSSVVLSDACLSGAHLNGTCLDDADLMGVDLSGVHGLTLRQAIEARSDQFTTWPYRTFSGHGRPISGLALSSDGKRAVSVGWDGFLKVWDTKAGKVVGGWTGHSLPIRCVSFIIESELAITGSVDKTLKVWELSKGLELFTLCGHLDAVTSVAATKDSRFAVSGSSDCTLRIWDIQNRCELRCLEGHFESVNGVSISFDGRMILSGAADETLKLWDLEDGLETRTLVGHTGPVYGVAFTPDGTCGLSASGDMSIKLWDLETGIAIRTFLGHTGPVYGVSSTSDGRYVISASGDGSVRLWELATGRELLCLLGHGNSVNAVEVDAALSLLISCSDDRCLNIWFSHDGSRKRYVSISEQNSELFRLQRVLCSGPTPEEAFSKYIDNSRLVLASGPARAREMRSLSMALVLSGSLLIAYVWQHTQVIELDYRITAQQAELKRLRDMNDRLTFADAVLTSPERIDYVVHHDTSFDLLKKREAKQPDGRGRK